MFIFAHVFAGTLLGLVFWHLAKDRRAIPVCIAASVLPDVIDKTLGLLLPAVFEGGRTVFHSLGIVLILLFIMLLFVQSSFRYLGVGVACAILLHQVLDEMWHEPVNWFYPLLGPFQGYMIPDYIRNYFWFEITNPSEWMFMVGTVVILIKSYQWGALILDPFLSDRMKNGVYMFIVAVFAGMGLFLVAMGLTSPAGTVITPFSNQSTNIMAGLLALCGAVIMGGEKYDTPQRIAP